MIVYETIGMAFLLTRCKFKKFEKVFLEFLIKE